MVEKIFVTTALGVLRLHINILLGTLVSVFVEVQRQQKVILW